MNDPVANQRTNSVDAALAEYMRRVDAGQSVDTASFVSEFPQIAEELHEFFASAQIVERMAGPLASTVQNANKVAETHVSSVGDSVSDEPPRQTKSGDKPSAGSIPKSFGRYRIEKQLGRGAMGAVYLATDTQLHREVALKLPTFDTSGGGEMVKRFYREARAVANLNHAGICPIFDVGKIEETHYISMAYIKGQPLADLVSIDKPLPIRSVVSLVRKMAIALDHAHSQGVVHRDLKPANVMIDERRQPLIMDFGLARRVDKDDQTRLTQDGMVLGTPAYMSPEQVQGQRDSGKQSDVYSLGVILYELLTGDLPYKGTIAAVIGQIMTTDAPPPSAKRAEVDANLDAICQQMMARQTEDRYATMKEAADALTAYLKQQASGRRQPADSSQAANAPALQTTTTADKQPDAVLKPATTGNLSTVAPRRDDRLSQLTAPWKQLPPRVKVIATSALAGLLLVMTGVVILLRTPHGTLRIEVRDPNITVKVDNQTVTLEEGLRGVPKTVDKHRLTVLVGETPVPLDKETTVRINGEQQKVSISVSGVELVGDMFNVSRDGKTVLKISLQRIESPAADVKPAPEIVAGPPIPDGPPGEVLVLPHGDFKVGSVSISSDGEWILTGGIGEFTGRETRLWSTRTGRMQESLPGCHLGAWLPDSRGFVTYLNYTVQSRTLLQPELAVAWNSPHNGVISPPAFTPDGSRALVGSWDKTISVWDVRSRKLLRTLELEDDESKRVDSVAISADGRTGFSYSPFTKLAICEWDLESGQLRKAIPVPLAGARGQFSSGGRRFVGHLSNKICLFDVKTGQTIQSWSGSEKAYHAVAISPQGRYVLAIGEDHVLRLWNAETAKLLHEYSGHTDNTWSVQFSKDLRLAVSASHDGTARVWRLPKLEPEPPLGPVTTPSAKPSNTNILTSPDWEWTEPENLGPLVNSNKTDSSPDLSADGLTLFFQSTRAGGKGGYDLWMCKRASRSEPFGKPVNLGQEINSPDEERCPSISDDGLLLVFTSNRPGRVGGGYDTWMSRRASKSKPFEKPVNLGPEVNSDSNDSSPYLSGDGLTLIFSSNRPGGEGYFDLWMSSRSSIEQAWAKPINLGPNVNSSGYESEPSLSSDGLTLLFDSRRPGGFGKYDLWISTRPSRNAPFGKSVNLGQVINTPEYDTGADLSFDGRTMFFASSRKGSLRSVETTAREGSPRSVQSIVDGIDLWMSRRVRKAGSATPQPYNWPADAPPPATAPFNAEQAKQHQEAWAKHLGVPVEYENSIGMKFRLIPPGEFLMGSTPEEIEAALKWAGEDETRRERIKSEAPQHKVILTQPVYVGVTEVTQSQYEQVMGTNPSHFSATGEGKDLVANLETGNHPVEMVSWNDAAKFCAKLSQQEELKPFYFPFGETITPLDGTGYRLPTEAEWESACRAGTTTRFWSGDTDQDLVSAGWFGSNSGGRTHAAGELKANPFGLSDVHGNVWEWVQDSWDPAFYGKSEGDATIDPSSLFYAGSQRVVRGGGWSHYQSRCRSSRRSAGPPTHRRRNHVGFRVVLVAESVRVSRP